MRIESALEKYVVQLEADGRSRHTTAQARRHVRLFAEWVSIEKGVVELDQTSHEIVAQFFVSDAVRLCADGSPRLPTSANAVRGSIKGFFRFVHEAGYSTTNAGRLIRRAQCRAPRPKALTEHDAVTLVDALARASSKAEQRDCALFTTLLRTGIRIGAALQLDISDVDFEQRQLTLRAQKGGGTDVVFFGDEVERVLRDAIGSRHEGAVFISSRGARLGVRQARRRLDELARSAGLDSIAPHALRHTFATRLARRTGDLLLVARAMTHRSLSSTMRYARVDDQALRNAVAM